MNNENSKKLYDALSQEYDLGSYEQFAEGIQDEGRRKKLYDAVSETFDLGDYDAFNSKLGFSTPSAPSAQEIAEEMAPQESTRWDKRIVDRLGQWGEEKKASKEGTSFADTHNVFTGKEKVQPTPEEVEQQRLAEEQIAATREYMQESGTIDAMEDAKKEARKDKRQALFRSMGTAAMLGEGIVNDEVSDYQMEQTREFAQNKLMQKTLNEALDMARQGEMNLEGSSAVGDFARGVWDEAWDISTWDMGYSDIVNGITLNQLVQKWENDPESLTATEKKVMEALGVSAAVQEAYAGTTGIGYAVGQSVPHSAAFMTSMALNPAKGVGEALAKGVVKKLGKQGVKYLGNTGAHIASGATRLVADAIETGVMVGTVGVGRATADALERINGRTEYTITPDGYIQYGGQADNEEVRTALWKGLGTQFIDGYTEAMGSSLFDPALDAIKGVARGGLKKEALNQFGNTILGVQPSWLAETARVIKKSAKVDSMLGELLEEEVGMIANALLVGDQSFDPNDPNYVFNLENQLTTLISTCLMTGAINGAEAVGDYSVRRAINKKANEADLAGKAKFGEGWDAIRDNIDNSEPEQVVNSLRDIFLDPTISADKKNAVVEYARRRITAQYFNTEEAEARRGLQKEQQAIYDAYNTGIDSRLPDFYNIRKAADEAEKNLIEYAENSGRMDVLTAAMGEINAAPQNMNEVLSSLSEEEQNLLADYIYSNARAQGAYQGRSDKAEDYVDEFAFALEPFVVTDDNGNRTITTATLEQGPNSTPVYVIKDDGTNAFIMYEDGSSKMVLSKDLKGAFTKDADEVIEVFRQQTHSIMDAETENAMAYREGVQEPVVGMQLHRGGEVFMVTAVNGDEVQVVPAKYNPKTQQMEATKATPQTISVEDAKQLQNDYIEDEEAKKNFKQGTEQTFYVNGQPVRASIRDIDAEGRYLVELYDIDGLEVGGVQKTKVDKYDVKELRELTTAPTYLSANQPQNESIPTDEIQQSVSEEVTNGQNVAPEENVSQATALSRIPLNDNGEPIYEAVDADTAWDAIMEQTEGDMEMAQRIAEEMVADKKDALAKMQKGKPKKGSTVAEKIANEKAHAAAIAQAEADVAAWKAIASTEARRREAAMSEADRYIAEMEEKSIAEGLQAIGEPQSLQEYVLKALAGGGFKLRWSDKENGTKGFGSHTGLSNEEMKARLSMVDNTNGLTPEEIAHSIVENMDMSFGDVDVMDITDMVIDAVATYPSRGSMLNALVESRAELIRQQEIAEQEAKDAWYMEQYHATEEELAAYNEYLTEFAEEIYGEDSDYEQRIATFAEIQLEYDNQGTDADLRSSADQGEGLASDREGGRSVGETEQLNQREVLGDAAGVAEAEDGRAGSSVSAESDVIETIKSELGVFSADNAAEYAARMFEAYKWKTLEEANESLKQLLASYGQKLGGQTLGVVPFLDAAQDQINAERDWQRYQEDVEADASSPVYTEERLDNGDVRVTGTNSNGQIATVAIERDGKVISVDSYDDGVLFERTDYDENGQATKVTRYKDGEVVFEEKYTNGKKQIGYGRKQEENQRNGRSSDRNVLKGRIESSVERTDGGVRSDVRRRGEEYAQQTGTGENGSGVKLTLSSILEFYNEGFKNTSREKRQTEEVAGIIRKHNAGKTLLARTENERELLTLLRALTNNEVENILADINEALKSGELTEEERGELSSAKNLIGRFVNRGERKAIINTLTGAKLGEKLPLSKIDELFEMYNSDANVAELYGRLRAIAEQIGLDFWFEEMEDIRLGGYLHQDNRVRLNAHLLYSPATSHQVKATTIVHEMIHAVAEHAIDAANDIRLGIKPRVQLSKQVINAGRSLIKLYNEVIKDNPALVHEEYDIEKGEWVEVPDYGTTSVHEMLSEIANPEFREKLKNIEYKKKNILQRIADIFKRMFSKASDVTSTPSAYDSMSKALDTLIGGFNQEEYNKLIDMEGYEQAKTVTDKATIEALEASPKRTGFRNVVLNEDGTFSSPMAYWIQHPKGGAKTRIEMDKFELGKWEEAQENPDLVDENGITEIVKPNKKGTKVAYDPYIHNRLEPVNFQFKEAWKRDDLVYVETEVAETDLNSGYHADKAKLPVGVHSWSNGALMLSKYDKPVRIMPWNEVADAWVERLKRDGETGVTFDIVPAVMRPLLVERGVEILPPTPNMGKACNDAYNEWKAEEGLLFRGDKKELVAIHNISEDNLRKVLDAGSLIMPSIAITKAEIGHEGYGDISLLFGKETIDPSDSRNKVYGGDAWTPRFPQIGFKLNEKVVRRVRDKAYEVITDRDLRDAYSLSAETYPTNIEDALTRAGVEGYYGKEWMKLAYLIDSGKKVKVPMKMINYGDMSEVIIGFAEDMGLTVAEIQEMGKEFYDNNPDFVAALKMAEDRKFVESIPEEKREAVRNLLSSKEMTFSHFDTLISKAFRMEYDLKHGGLKQIIDKNALTELIEKKVKTNNANYNKWVDELFDGIVEKRGIRNNRDWYTSSGNQRSWEQLYDPATPANILKHMLAQNEQGGSGGFFDSNIMGASAETYESIEEIREKGQQRLKKLPYEEYDEWSDSVAERMAKICDDFLSPSQKNSIGGAIDAKIEITNVVAKDKTAKGIYKHMKREYPNFTMEHAKQVEEIVKEIQEFTTGYFEAKPQRLVPLSEVSVAVVPKKTSSDIIEALEAKGVKVVTYNGTEESRKKAVERESKAVRFREGEGEISDKEVSYQNDPIAKWMGKPRYTGKKAAEFAERERKRMRQAVAEVSEALGVKVTALDSTEGLSKRKAKAKGWFNIETDEIVVVIPNHVSAWDAVQSVLHEGVAHYGLRKLFGEKLDVVLDNIYNNVDPELKAKIDSIAKKSNVSTPVATEEYLASLSETTNFEQAVKQGWWAKIKQFFMDLVEHLAIEGDVYDEPLTDNELRYLLWSSYQNLIKKVQTPMDIIEDNAMQRELKVGRFAPTSMAAESKVAEPSEFTESDDIRYREVSAPFYSNAERAVENIKQNKATPEQWLAMIKKDGGLKAGEDKWMGLSDWLTEKKDAGVKSLTKDEVLQFIRENQIEIEEVEYREEASERYIQLQDEFSSIVENIESEYSAAESKMEQFDEEMHDKYGDGFYYMLNEKERNIQEKLENALSRGENARMFAYEDMISTYGDDFKAALEVDYRGRLVPTSGYNGVMSDEARHYLGINPINSTRLDYTTEGLENKKEIAFVVPTIESWNQSDNIHFGDAGEGRAVAWVRFGETTTPREEKVVKEVKLGEPYKNFNGDDVYPTEYKKDYISHKTLRDGSKRFVPYVNEKFIGNTVETASFDTLDEAKAAMNAFYKEHPLTKVVNERVLVIDEVQSKRHDEGRSKGYKQVSSRTEAYGKFKDIESSLANKYGNEFYYLESDEEIKDLVGEEDFEVYASIRDEYIEARRFVRENNSRIPDAPFDKNYHELVMKRMLRYAAENGFDKVAWTKGEQQARRYNLNKVFDTVEREDNPNLQGKRFVLSGANTETFQVGDDGVVVDATIADAKGKTLESVVGVDMAKQMMSLENGDMVEGQDFAIGGEDRNALYDEMIPRFMNKYVKKWGAKVGEVTLPNVEEAGRTMWSVDVTPEMKESVMQGQPMFRTAEVVNEGEYLTEDKLKDIASEAAKLGVKVRVANDVSELDPQVQEDIAKGRPIKGYYDTRTGEVVVYAPYATSGNDVKRTILHEIVGHKGLRQLLGDKNFDKTMMQMYRMLPEAERKNVWDAAIKKYGDLSVSMEEYLAEKAENLEKPKWWQGILTALKMAFRRATGVYLTDADINYLLWRGRKKLEKDTYFEMAVNATLKRAAQQSDLTEEEIAQLKDAEMRIFEKSERARYLRNRVGDAQREYEEAVRTTAYRSQEAFQDSMLGLKKLQEAIAKESGREIRDWENAYMAENRMASVNLREMEMFKKREYQELLKSISDLMDMGEEHDAIVNYMMAKHGLERNEKFARRDAVRDAEGDTNKEQQLYENNRKTDYSGLTALTGNDDVKEAEDAAQKMVDEFEKRMPTHLVNALWSNTRACTHKTLEISHDAGIMSDESYNDLLNQFEYYIPLRGFDEKTAEDIYFYVGGKESPYNPPIKSAYGRKSKASNPIANIGNMAESAIVEANRNKLKQEFYNMVVNHKTDLVSVSDLWMRYDSNADAWVAEFPEIPNDATPSEVKAAMARHEENMQRLVQQYPDLYAKASENPNIPYRVVKKADMNEHQIIVKRNGKDVVLTINGNPRAAQAINGLTNPELKDEWYNQAASWINRNLSANFTTRNPAFVVSNFVRDAIYTNSMVWVKESPTYARKYHKNFGKATTNIASLVGKYKQYEAGDKSALDMNDPMQKMFYEFMMNGGETGYTIINSVDNYKKMSKKGISKLLRKGDLKTGQNVVDALAEGFDTFGRWAEDTSRFAAYMTSREMGRSISRSIYDAKEISVNFNKKGSGSRMREKFKDDPMAWIASTLSQSGRGLYVFWNAGVQGLSNFGRVAIDNKGKFTVMAMAAMAAGTIIPMLFSGDDEDDEYYLLPEYVRRNNICFKVGEKSFITLPLPIEIRALYGIGELAYSYLSGKEDLTPKEATTKLFQQVSQVMPIDMLADGGGLMALTPSAVRPIVEAAFNVNWTGEPIYKQETPFNENMPTWTLAYKSTSPELVKLSRMINEATNEDMPSGEERVYNRGWDNRFFNNPAVWEHIYEGYLGGIGTMTNQTKKSVMMLWDEDMRDVRNVPIASRFVKFSGDRAKEYSLNDDYYNALDVVDKLSDERAALKRDVRDAKTQSEYDKALKVYSEMESVAGQTIAEQNRLKKAVKNLEAIQKENPDAMVTFGEREMPVKEAIQIAKQQAIDNAIRYVKD